MSQFDLSQLEGGWQCFEFPAKKGETIKLYAHQPTQGEEAAAMKLAGLCLNQEGNIDTSKIDLNDVLPRREQMQEHLAIFCLEDAQGLEGWPQQPKQKGPFGYEVLSEEALSLVPWQILRHIGKELDILASLGESQGNSSEPPPSGSTTKSSGGLETTAKPATTPQNSD